MVLIIHEFFRSEFGEDSLVWAVVDVGVVLRLGLRHGEGIRLLFLYFGVSIVHDSLFDGSLIGVHLIISLMVSLHKLNLLTSLGTERGDLCVMALLISHFDPLVDWQEIDQDCVAVHSSVHELVALDENVNIEFLYRNVGPMSEPWVNPHKSLPHEATIQVNLNILSRLIVLIIHILLEELHVVFSLLYHRLLFLHEKFLRILHINGMIIGKAGYEELLLTARPRILLLLLIKNESLLGDGWLLALLCLGLVARVLIELALKQVEMGGQLV